MAPPKSRPCTCKYQRKGTPSVAPTTRLATAKPAASVRISPITWAGRIPTAMSMPNSRVRSNTAMSIVFMTPITADQEEDKEEDEGDAVIELNVVGQFRRELRPCHHSYRKSLTQSSLKGGSHDVAAALCRFSLIPTSWILAGTRCRRSCSEDRDIRTKPRSSGIKTGVKNPDDGVQVVAHRTVGRLRQQNDF